MRRGSRFSVGTRNSLRQRTWPALGAFLVASAVLAAACQAGGGYPARQITIVVPFAAGGPTDTVTRLVAAPMERNLGQAVVVSNVAGAGGTTAAGQVAAAAGDGYTVLMHHIGMSTAPSLYADLTYDPLTSFKTVGLVTEVPMTIVGKRDLPPNTLQELVTYVQENAATLTYANAGVGAASHLCGRMIEDAFGVDLTEASYDGTGPAMIDLVGGHVDFMCDQTTSTTDQIRAGEIKAYAVTTATRATNLPDVPTTAEGGLPQISVGVWHGLYVPSATPDDVVNRLNQALLAALGEQAVIDRLADLGAAPTSAERATPAIHRQLLTDQISFWRPLLSAP